jgi:hypothetical protein
MNEQHGIPLVLIHHSLKGASKSSLDAGDRYLKAKEDSNLTGYKFELELIYTALG